MFMARYVFKTVQLISAGRHASYMLPHPSMTGWK